jgi:proline racemase/trans-L-3-hydroxyproline dehydratase
MALLAADGRVGKGRELTHDSVIGTRFISRVVETVSVDGRAAVVTEVVGRAFRTGQHMFVREPGDPVDDGFLLR